MGFSIDDKIVAPVLARLTARRPPQMPSTMYEPQDEYWRLDPSPSAAFLKSTAICPDCASDDDPPRCALDGHAVLESEGGVGGMQEGMNAQHLRSECQIKMDTALPRVGATARHMKRRRRSWHRSSMVSSKPSISQPHAAVSRSFEVHDADPFATTTPPAQADRSWPR
jgi:hypothetical protein